MNNLNLIKQFFLVGRPQIFGENKHYIFTITRTNKGWIQQCEEKIGLDRLYVNNENNKELTEWFICDFYEFSFFTEYEEAQNYLKKTQKSASFVKEVSTEEQNLE